jgi:ATP-dependent helicase YprA (DUF1998 family)
LPSSEATNFDPSIPFSPSISPFSVAHTSPMLSHYMSSPAFSSPAQFGLEVTMEQNDNNSHINSFLCSLLRILQPVVEVYFLVHGKEKEPKKDEKSEKAEDNEKPEKTEDHEKSEKTEDHVKSDSNEKSNIENEMKEVLVKSLSQSVDGRYDSFLPHSF